MEKWIEILKDRLNNTADPVEINGLVMSLETDCNKLIAEIEQLEKKIENNLTPEILRTLFGDYARFLDEMNANIINLEKSAYNQARTLDAIASHITQLKLSIDELLTKEKKLNHDPNP